jgi:hypothetical protein
MKSSFAALAVGTALSCLVAAPANAQLEEQRIQTRDRDDILQSIRDQIQARLKAQAAASQSTGNKLRFTAEDPSFDNDNPFAARDVTDPFAALAYAKAPYTKAPPPPAIPVWLYGVNGIASFDRTGAGGATLARTTTGTVAVDVTKIGIFTTSDALTFLATGSDSWSRIPAAFNASTPSGSGTFAYTNGGFSADLTSTASWTTNGAVALGIAAPANSSMMTYTGNAQYKVDLEKSWFIEPTAGVTYTNFYTANFGASTGSSTEIHAGGRIGTEVTVYGIKMQPQASGAAFQIVSVSGAGGVAAAGAPNVAAQLNQLGGRGAAKLNFLWTNSFSTYVEAHVSSVAGTNTAGVSGGLRYSF